MKKCVLALALAIFLFAFLAPAFGLSVRFDGASSGQVTSSSTAFKLSPDSTASMQTTLWGSQSESSISASGKGSVQTTTNGLTVAAQSDNMKADIGMTDQGLSGNVEMYGMNFPIEARSDLVRLDEALVPGGTVGAVMTGPATTPDGGNSAAYYLQGRKWFPGIYTEINGKVLERSPGYSDGINLYLLNDPALRAEGLNPTAVQNALATAANTWDDATNENLFADANLVTVTSDPLITSGKYDQKNTVAFKAYGSNCNAMASAATWFRLGKVDGYYPIVESDITFNTAVAWGTGDPRKADFQSVALHELGHTIGLGDLYNKAQFSTDTRQVMHYYTGVKRTLGNGDATGVWKLYG